MLSDPDYEDNLRAAAVSRHVAVGKWPSTYARAEAKRERKRVKRLVERVRAAMAELRSRVERGIGDPWLEAASDSA